MLKNLEIIFAAYCNRNATDNMSENTFWIKIVEYAMPLRLSLSL